MKWSLLVLASFFLQVVSLHAQNGPNRVVNGSFEDPTIPDESVAGGPLAGWTSDVGFEIWRGLFGFPAHDGSQHLEMDVNENSTIFQDIATVPGATYRFSFALANREFDGCGSFCSPVSRIEASWDGNVVLTAEQTEGSWKVFETMVTATAATTRLQLRAAGESDSLGDFLDDVQVAAVRSHVITGVVDAAGFRPRISPGSIASVFGNFAEMTATASSIPLSESLGGFSVTFNGTPGTLFGVFDGEFDQSNVQVPWNLGVSSSKAEVKVHWEDESGEFWSEPFEVDIAPASPGIYMYPPGTTQAAVVNFKAGEEDDVIAGSWAQAPGTVDPVVGQPAAIGGVVTIWGNGLGPVSPLPATGDIPPAGTVPFTDKTVRVFIGGVEAQVLSAVLQPSNVGLNQINAVIPVGVAPGDDTPIVIEVECDDGMTIRSREDVTIAVRAAP